ncbi:MAG: hypothetical protein IPM92_04020 [Saprospiraceae bacterium]|nr:hypothetical protein [Saprospiraceae bacterium]
MTVKEKILSDIQNIENEELLQEVYTLIQDLKGCTEMLILNEEQNVMLQEAQKQYEKGLTHSHDELFKELLGE